jgi:hypothetical protein
MAVQIDFAMPLGHATSGPFTNFPAGTVTIGKPFRQPFDFDGQAANFAPGLDFVIADSPVTARSNLYAFVGGILEFFPAVAPRRDRLVLELRPAAGPNMQDLFRRFTLETPPLQVVYENVDVALTRAAISTLITTAGHVARTGVIPAALATSLALPNPKTQTIDRALGPTNTPAVLNAILDQFLKVTAAAAEVVKISVDAADFIAVAGTRDAATRGCLWSLLDLGHQILSPYFFLKQFIDGQSSTGSPKVTTRSLTSLTIGQPVLGLQNAATSLNPRERVTITVGTTSFPQIPFSLGPLGEFHGFPLFPAGASKARWERRLIPSAPPAGSVVSQIEARTASAAHTPVPIQAAGLTGAAALAKVQTIWASYGATVNAICTEIGIPCELVVAIMAKESGASESAYRLEPLLEIERATLAKSPVANLIKSYDKTIGVAGTASAVASQAARASLLNVHSDNDGRPRTDLRVQLNGTSTRTFKKFVSWAKPWKASARGRRHFLIDDQRDTFVAVVRGVRPVTAGGGPSNRMCDFTVDDQQLDLDRGKFTANARTPLQKCSSSRPHETQAANTIRYYKPDDACVSVPPATTATAAAVQYTVARSATLRALYVDVATANKPTANVVVSVVRVVGTTETVLITTTLAANTASAAETTVTAAVSTNDLLSVKIETGAAPVTGIRVRVHLAPVNGATVYLLDGCGFLAPTANNTCNEFPSTGANPGDAVRGANGNAEHPMTWDELCQVIDQIQGNNISPGAIQTLISAADSVLTTAQRAQPNLVANLAGVNVTPPPTGANHFSRYFAETAAPGAPRPRGWLLQAPNSILCGACHMKVRYAASSFDFPAVCGGFNTGSVSKSVSDWGVNVSADYWPKALVYYNAAVAFFEGPTPPNPVPAVRYRP